MKITINCRITPRLSRAIRSTFLTTPLEISTADTIEIVKPIDSSRQDTEELSESEVLHRLFAKFEATSIVAVPFPKLAQLDVRFVIGDSDIFEMAIEQKPAIHRLMERRTEAGARVLNLEDITQTFYWRGGGRSGCRLVFRGTM